jgi:prepilin-type N-terminal cleavage/methylation domain-containing protein
MTRFDPRAGFTLVEVLIALALGALVLLCARLLAGSIALGFDRIVEARTTNDRLVLPERKLRALLRRVEVGTDSARTFGGGEHNVRFTSWCDVAAGWQERCEVLVWVDASGSAQPVRLHTSSGDDDTLGTSAAQTAFRYLRDAHGGGEWVARWGTSLTAPSAILLVQGADSLILRIGERG